MEESLFEHDRFRTAKAYILYRMDKEKTRGLVEWKDGLLSREFLSRYKHAPNPMGELGSFVYSRTYSRYLPVYNRREFWWETVRRAVEYNCSLAPTTREEAERLYDNVFHLRQFLSGRTLWVGATPVSAAYPMANYNCAFEVIDDFRAYHDLFYLLMVGSGVGVRVLRDDAAKLPKIRTNLEIVHKAYKPAPEGRAAGIHQSGLFPATRSTSPSAIPRRAGRRRSTTTSRSSPIWSTRASSASWSNTIPSARAGERLKVFGGTASGYESMLTMLDKIHRVIRSAGLRDGAERTQLRPIDLLDIANIIGENVVSGGVRRTSEIGLIDQDDNECIQAKSRLYRQIGGRWEIDKSIAHRQMSNNSIFYRRKPTREQLHWHLQQMRYSGEPGWVNEAAGLKRRPNFCGCNPCGEILLDSHGLCNLTTVNVMAFVRDGALDEKGLLEAQRLSARAGLRMTCRELEMHRWNQVQQRDRLLGCSLTGWQDMVNAVGMSREEQAALLDRLRATAHEAARKASAALGLNAPLLVTTVKPEGTLSLLPTVSSGIHYSHAPYYVRRIRISSSDPLCRVCEELGYPVYPEVGQDPETCRTKVVEFPVKAPAGKVKGDVSAIEQLENYKMFMEHYVDHNCSITVHVRENEWDDVEQWVWDHWDDVVALSFLSYDENFYELLPYEAITEAEYEARRAKMRPFNPALISKYEREETELDIGSAECANGVCPVR